MKSSRPRPRSLDSIDETDAQKLHEHRDEIYKSGRFQRQVMRWIDGDRERGCSVAILFLREVSGWSLEMLGNVFGCGSARAGAMVRDAKTAVQGKPFAAYLDHRADTYVMIRTVDAELMLESLLKTRKFFRDDDTKVDGVIDALKASLAARES